MEQIILAYMERYQCMDIEIGAKRIGGQIFFASNKYIETLPGIRISKDVIGRGDDFISEVLGGKRAVEFFTLLEKMVVAGPTIIDFILNNVRNDGYLSFGTYIPLLDENNNCFAVQFLYRRLTAENFNLEVIERMIIRYNPSGIVTRNVFGIAMNDREELILTLLMSGFTQHQIAEKLNCSRSFIAKVISEQLCPKFNVPGYSAKILIEKAIKLGYDRFISGNILFKVGAE